MIKFIHKNILNPCQVVDNLAETEGILRKYYV